ncbi:hypothetical protein ACWENR_08205 [Micromonospora sp. NPDC004336]
MGDGLDELESYAPDATVAAALRDWAGHLGGTVHRPRRPRRARGYTPALLFTIILKLPGGPGRFTGRKLLVKVLPAAAAARREPGRHERAVSSSPGFAERHLVRQPYPPHPLVDGRFLMFQEIANGADDMVTLHDLDDEEIVPVIREVCDRVLNDWNSGGRQTATATVGEYVRRELAALDALDGLHDAVRDLGLPGPETAWPAWDGAPELPNPLRTLGAGSPFGADEIDYLYGNSHGDLHGGNVLVLRDTEERLVPGTFRLVDLNTFEDDAPLTRDLTTLVLTTVLRHVADLPPDQADALTRHLVFPTGRRPSRLPPVLAELVNAGHQVGGAFARTDNWVSEWRAQYLLSLLCQALTCCTYDNVPFSARRWCFQLAAWALEAYRREFHQPVGRPPAGPARATTPAPAGGAGQAGGCEPATAVAPDNEQPSRYERSGQPNSRGPLARTPPDLSWPPHAAIAVAPPTADGPAGWDATTPGPTAHHATTPGHHAPTPGPPGHYAPTPGSPDHHAATPRPPGHHAATPGPPGHHATTPRPPGHQTTTPGPLGWQGTATAPAPRPHTGPPSRPPTGPAPRPGTGAALPLWLDAGGNQPAFRPRPAGENAATPRRRRPTAGARLFRGGRPAPRHLGAPRGRRVPRARPVPRAERLPGAPARAAIRLPVRVTVLLGVVAVLGGVLAPAVAQHPPQMFGRRESPVPPPLDGPEQAGARQPLADLAQSVARMVEPPAEGAYAFVCLRVWSLGDAPPGTDGLRTYRDERLWWNSRLAGRRTVTPVTDGRRSPYPSVVRYGEGDLTEVPPRPSADPADLRDQFARQLDALPPEQRDAAGTLQVVARLNRYHPLDAAQRSALLHHLAGTPAIQRRGAFPDRAGRPGLAFSADDQHGRRETLLFDPTSGELLSHETTRVSDDAVLGHQLFLRRGRTDTVSGPSCG